MALLEELYDVFYVTQLTQGTALESVVAVDRVRVEPKQSSGTHRHNDAETVLYIEKGSGVVKIGATCFVVNAGDRITIPKGSWHSVHTAQNELVFTSVQSPPIHDEKTGRHDLEPIGFLDLIHLAAESKRKSKS